MLYAATCLQLCRITSATLVSQEYHKTIQTSRGSKANLQKKYRFFKIPPLFYRNSSVTKAPKTLQLCCASLQNQPSATASAHFPGCSDAYRSVYYRTFIHYFAYQCFVCAFVALCCVPVCILFLYGDFVSNKHTKKGLLHITLCNSPSGLYFTVFPCGLPQAFSVHQESFPHPQTGGRPMQSGYRPPRRSFSVPAWSARRCAHWGSRGRRS